VKDLAQAVSALSDRLQSILPTHLSQIIEARGNCHAFAPNTLGDGRDYFQHIDLGLFCDEIRSRVDDIVAGDLAAQTRGLLNTVVLANWAGPARQNGYGSSGLAIYFPETNYLYTTDPYEKGGYKKDNTYKIVDFVRDNAWADFIHRFLALVH
jgi:hypothetical protein